MSGRSDRIRELYEAALKRPIGERAAFVATQTKDDRDLRQRVEALLAGQHDTQIAGYESSDGDSTVLATGTVIGQYRIDGPLGAGGMGVVYRATDTKLNRPAAIKVLPESLADPEARRRFQREAQMASSLNHPHIVTVYDAGEYRERQYLITEYVDGGTLRQWAIRPHGWRSIVELLTGVADAVAVAHEAGILHRDIKPENILLAKSGYAKLADFGLAKLLETDPLADDAFAGVRLDQHSSLVGTAAYMSPEQAQGRPLDARSDVYSFGLVLHELLSGERPSSTRSLEQRHGAEAEALAALPAEVPAELRTIVGKALEAEPADRYQTMRELVVDLRRLVRHSTSETPRRPAPYLWAAVAVLALVAVGTYFFDAMRSTGGEESVAVLPFANETGSPMDDRFSEGLGDALRDRLMELPGLEVQARASSVSFRGQIVDSRAIASTLRVGRLVNGSLRRNGKMLEVLVEVLDDEGFAIAPSLRYQRLERDFQAMQSEIAVDVSALLAPEAANDVVANVETPTAASERANILVVSGKIYEYDVKRELTIDQTKLDIVIDLYTRATQTDPISVAAHARLAGALLYNRDVEGAAAPLLRALELGNSLAPTSASADLSDAYFSYALYLLSTGSRGADEAYRKAIELNPNNADALGAYAQWLMIHHRADDANEYFRRAIEHDRQSVARYADYAEALGIREDMEGARALALEIAERFPDAAGYLRLARVYEVIGDLDVGIAWGLRALALAPNDRDTLDQIAELYTRIGELDEATEFAPENTMSQLYLRRHYAAFIDVAEIYVIENYEDLRAKQWLGFAYNATGEFASARLQLEGIGMTPYSEWHESVDFDDVQTYVDTLQALGEYDAVRALAESSANNFRLSVQSGYEKSWWTNSHLACFEAQLGRDAEVHDQAEAAQAHFTAALAALERLRAAQGLAWSHVILDSLCFEPIANEPGYRAVVARLEQRQKELRDRLPATLIEYGVADVRP